MTDMDLILKHLNDAFAADPAAIHALIVNRVPCNTKLADHPTVQVDHNGPGIDGYTVGLLGMLNAVIEPLTGNRVCFAWEDAPADGGRAKPIGFRLYQQPTPIA